MQIMMLKLAALLREWRWALRPALPLIAVLAMVMFFAWGQSSDQAEAAGPTPGMALKAPATVEVGSKFTVTISGNPVPAKGNPGFGGFGAEVQVSAGLKYNGSGNCLSELKATVQGGAPPELCSSFTDVAGDHAIVVLTAFTAPLPELDASGTNEDLANFSYQCNTQGTKTITLLTAAQSPDGARYVAPDASDIFVKTKVGANADQITIDCVVPALPGMALKAPATVELGSKFTVTISGNPVPPKGSPGFGGFGAEVEVSAGLKYNGSGACLSELKATVQGGGSLAVCSSFTNGAGNHVISVLTAFTTPLPEMDASGLNEDLVNFSYQCNTQGTKTITLLTFAQSSDDGARYVAPDASTIALTTKVGDNADQITIDCGDVGGVAELPEVAGRPLEATGSSGSNTGLIAGIVAAIAAGSATLTSAAWYARRRWV